MDAYKQPPRPTSRESNTASQTKLDGRQSSILLDERVFIRCGYGGWKRDMEPEYETDEDTYTWIYRRKRLWDPRWRRGVFYECVRTECAQHNIQYGTGGGDGHDREFVRESC